VKHLHLGLAAERGIRAARLASLGWPGADYAIEGPKGFLAACAQPGRHAPGEEISREEMEDILLGGLGETWAIQRNIFKRYPFCLGISEPLEGLKEILRQAPDNIDNIANILIETSPSVAWTIGNPDPQDDCQARFSVSYALALLLAGLDPAKVPMPSQWREDRRVREWMPRISIEGRPEIGWRKALVTVIFRDQTCLRADQPLQNLPENEVLSRLEQVVNHFLPAAGKELVEIIAALDQQKDLTELGLLLRSAKGDSYVRTEDHRY